MQKNSLDILREILPLPYRIVVNGESCFVIRKSEFDLLLTALDEKFAATDSLNKLSDMMRKAACIKRVKAKKAWQQKP